jgi:hypothetical protein
MLNLLGKINERSSIDSWAIAIALDGGHEDVKCTARQPE